MTTTPSTPPAAPTPDPKSPKATRRLRGCFLPLALAVLFISLLVNLGVALIYFGAIDNPLESDPTGLTERFLFGDPNARDKIAVVRVSGVISESGIQYPLHQLEAAARDKRVKAVVLRIDSPGGTVTASEELYQNLLNLRDNNGRRFNGSAPKPISVSMGGVAASGGYYIAVAGNPISAEPTTITGSIGVFAALPNVAEWAKNNGVRLELVKAGGIKASGSFFHTLSPEERQTWQDTVDNAYDLFLGVISTNRPKLTVEELRDKIVEERMIVKRDEKGNPLLDAAGKEIQVKYTRRRADGGTFTSRDAKKYDLIDHVEDLPATIRRAASSAGLTSFQAIVYDRTPGLFERLTGVQIRNPRPIPDLADVSSALTPRLWYLAPSADSGLLTIAP
jgi:protease IV